MNVPRRMEAIHSIYQSKEQGEGRESRRVGQDSSSNSHHSHSNSHKSSVNNSVSHK